MPEYGLPALIKALPDLVSYALQHFTGLTRVTADAYGKPRYTSLRPLYNQKKEEKMTRGRGQHARETEGTGCGPNFSPAMDACMARTDSSILPRAR